MSSGEGTTASGADRGVPLGALDQVGIVVADLDRVERAMAHLLGIAPSGRVAHRYKGARVHGEPADPEVEILTFDLGGIELEFLCPGEGKSTWREWLETRGEGIHHLRWQTPSQQAALAHLEESGLERTQEGGSMRGGDVRFAYHDATVDLGFFIETLGPALAETEREAR